MSLRAFHILFIVVSLALMGFLAWWSGERLLRGENGLSWALASVSFLGLAVGLPYLGWFIRKIQV